MTFQLGYNKNAFAKAKSIHQTPFHYSLLPITYYLNTPEGLNKKRSSKAQSPSMFGQPKKEKTRSTNWCSEFLCVRTIKKIILGRVLTGFEP